MNREDRLKRLRFRASHRGIREADLLIGAFFEKHHREWGEAEMAWLETLLEEQDVDILAWAMGTDQPPKRFAGEMMKRLGQVSYIQIPE
jgi:antitoxin CptB